MTLAPPIPVAQHVGDDQTSARFRLFGLVRDVRVEAQAIRSVLQPVRAALDLADASARAAELAAVLAEVEGVIDTSRIEVDARLAAIRDLVEVHSRIYDEAGDTVAELENRWREVERGMAWGPDPSPNTVARRVAAVDASVAAIEWHAALVTIPIRVRQHLETKRVGGQLHFHDAFRDEIADEQRRVELLRYLREHSASFSGVVDVPSGVVYRVGPTPARRAGSWVAVIGLATVGAYGLVFVLTHGLPAAELRFDGLAGIEAARFPELMGAYWALLIGAIAHVAVEAIKQDQRSDPAAFRALADWFLWVHVRETALIVGVLSLFAVLVGLALLMPQPGTLTFVAAFGAGYSFDSVLGLFITRFDGSARSAAEVVTGRLTAAPPSGRQP